MLYLVVPQTATDLILALKGKKQARQNIRERLFPKYYNTNKP